MNTSDAPCYLHYRLRLQSPAVISSFPRNPNGVSTQPFIPGSTLRGVLAARLVADGVTGDSDVFRRLILSGKVRYLHAYPELEGERSLPVSLSWRSEKANDMPACDLAAFSGAIDPSVDSELFGEVWPEKALVSVHERFAAPFASSGAVTIWTPLTDSRLHQQRDRIKGRPWKDRSEQSHGALFGYEYLKPEQVFRGIIQVMPGAAADIGKLKRLLEAEPVLVGRSRRAGYGGEAKVEFIGETQHEYENVSGWITRDLPVGTLFRAFMASSYIGRHPTTGQIDPSVLPEELLCHLSGAAEVVRIRWAFETLGGFNQKWRLEVPQALGVAAGAVVVLRAADAIPVATLRKIEHKGIGERRVEGFGRVLFLEHSEHQREIRLKRVDDRVEGDNGSSSALAPVSSQDRGQLDFLEQRIVLAAVRSELERVAAIDLVRKAKGKLPSNSLLGRLRTLFRTVTDEPTAQAALAKLRIWCTDGDDPQALRANAREKLDRCQINNRSLRQWLRELAESDHGEAGWKALLDASGNQATLSGLTEKSYLTDRSRADTVLHRHSALLRVHLIDAVLSTMARVNRGEEK